MDVILSHPFPGRFMHFLPNFIPRFLGVFREDRKGRWTLGDLLGEPGGDAHKNKPVLHFLEYNPQTGLLLG